jgi:hypothetical protein
LKKIGLGIFEKLPQPSPFLPPHEWGQADSPVLTAVIIPPLHTRQQLDKRTLLICFFLHIYCVCMIVLFGGEAPFLFSATLLASCRFCGPQFPTSLKASNFSWSADVMQLLPLHGSNHSISFKKSTANRCSVLLSERLVLLIHQS